MLRGENAVIVGGGISGKLAARVLSDFFQEVIILERDSEPHGPFPRKGAPQGEHIHALLFAGANGLEELFPGITEKFNESGAVKINSTQDIAWFHHGVWKLRYEGDYTTILQTRPHLEWHIEQYIKSIPNITIKYSQNVQNFLYFEEENRITGVEIINGNDSIRTINADLIVDASGVNSLSSRWLNKREVHIPEETVKIDLSYFTKTLQLPDNKNRDWSIKLVYPTPPFEKIGGGISKVEGNRYLVTFMGYHNEINEKEILKSDDGFIEIAKKLPKMDIYQELQDATALSSTSTFRLPNITWRRFDKLNNFPNGLLMIGDTICRIDPFFGQGMSIAILEALALKKLLTNQKHSNQKMIETFHQQAVKIISPIWNMVITEDFRYPATIGKKPTGLSIQQWYAKNIFHLSSEDKDIYNSFIKVMHLLRPTSTLMHPRIIKSVLKRTFTNNR
ncbi:glutamate synthase subunit beta [Bacillus sp. AFS076308]|uniref:FAD-dependent oxidoreductase n=1 Tax=unclassified Bacillus (in: firmicutes) TaxID=185979 RepID=UPI000BF7F2C4|nr:MULTISPECIES: FAD-dependent monooxygenase [unclassified Bacillus (in: firmicutes)]PFN76184.1 glutamate synthase subunit beta [Bacillus sp. AFS076308]PGV48351.1 glutamate synthase subunit beta [Bacillus sp. AFS037270]